MSSFLKQYICLLIIEYIHSASIEDFDVISAGNACFSASSSDESTIFNAPQNGTISGIQLTRINGSIQCDNIDSYWGCNDNSEGSLFYVMFLHLTDISNYKGELYYPQLSSQVNYIHRKASR